VFHPHCREAAFAFVPPSEIDRFVARNGRDKLGEDIDEALLRKSLALTPTQRIAKLMEMQRFMDMAKKARTDAADGSPPKAR